MMYENCKVVILKEKETLPQRDWKKKIHTNDPYNEEIWEDDKPLPEFRYENLSHHYNIGNYHDVLRADLVLIEKPNGEFKIVKNRFQ